MLRINFVTYKLCYYKLWNYKKCTWSIFEDQDPHTADKEHSVFILYFLGISMGFRRRMIATGKTVGFYFLQNVWKFTVFDQMHLNFAKSSIMQNLTLIPNSLKWAPKQFRKKVIDKKLRDFWVFSNFLHFLHGFFASGFENWRPLMAITEIHLPRPQNNIKKYHRLHGKSFFQTVAIILNYF